MIYFDHAATSFPKSKSVIDAVAEAMLRCGNPGRGSHAAAVYAAEELYRCREAIGGLAHCPPEHVILTPNTTFALNTAINGIVEKGRVIMSCLEHNSVCRPLYALERAGKISLGAFDVDIYDDAHTLEAVKKLCRRKVTAAVITHASNVCGKILPVKQIAEMVHDAGGVVILDAAQSAGHTDVSFEATGADLICFAGHKRLGGPLGTGALAVCGKSVGKIKPLLYGGSGISSLEKEMPKVLPERLEAGTLGAPLFAGLATAIENLSLGNESKVFGYLVERLKKMPGIILYGCPDNDICGHVPVLLFNVKGMGSDAVAGYFASHDICVRSGWHCAPLAHKHLKSNGGVRISVGEGNTTEEAEKLIQLLEALMPAR